MRLFYYLLLILVAGCASKSGNDPVSVTKSYLHALNEKDFAKAKSYATKEFARQLERVERSTQEHSSPKANVEFINERYELVKDMDSIAIVSMTAQIKDMETGLALEAWLRKEDGKWLINELISKD
jgi:hypothetical protein